VRTRQIAGADPVNSTDAQSDPSLLAMLRDAQHLGVIPHDEHVRLAIELIERAQHAKARRVIWCPPYPPTTDAPAWSIVPRGACGVRQCPSCRERRCQRLATQTVATVSAYVAPVAVLVTSPSKTLLDLPSTVKSIRENVWTMRRRRWFAKACTGGSLALELPLTKDQRRWAVHCHGVLDVRLDGDALAKWAERAGEEWRALTGRDGALFELEELRSPRAMMEYALKLGRDDKSWAPAPRSLPFHLAAHVERALFRKRLIISWGSQKGGA
jgi:hypothetical protein